MVTCSWCSKKINTINTSAIHNDGWFATDRYCSERCKQAHKKSKEKTKGKKK